MAGYRSIRRVPSLRSIVARRRKRIRYSDFTASQPVKIPKSITGDRLK